jgi:hypothetical protein
MAAKKKGDSTTTSTDTTTATTPQDEAAPGQEPANGNEDITVIAEGQHEVDLLDLGISAEDIVAMRRVDARLKVARRAKIQAL